MSEGLAPGPAMRKDDGMLRKANSILRSLPRPSRVRPVLLLGLGLGSGLVAGACDSKSGAPGQPQNQPPDASTTAEAGAAGPGAPVKKPSDASVPSDALDTAKVQKVLNPTGLPAYTGPFASIEGTIRITGAPPPDKPVEISPECESARSFFGPLFRKGPKGELADVLVAVTGYEGIYVPEKAPAVTVLATDCTWDSRTYVVTYGQRLDVKNNGKTTGHIPQLLGAHQSAMRLAIPGGPPVSTFPDAPGHMQLIDASALFMAADLFVVRYPTTGVTDVAGHYRIDGIPAGEVTVNALLPATQATAKKVVKLKAGETAQVDFELNYSGKK